MIDRAGLFNRLESLFTPGTAEVVGLIRHFQQEMRRGLKGETSSIAMHPAFVSRPSGRETGEFVALDLGGTNVRATVVELADGGVVRVKRRDSFRLSTLSGGAADLFDPVAAFLGEMLKKDRRYALGFTFAFPTDQTGIAQGRLTKWTKEFAFEGVEGEDVVSLLVRSICGEAETMERLRSVSVTALVNDTVGVLATGAFLDTRCDMGLIVATGANMAVALEKSLVGRPYQGAVGDHDEMVFNMECGNYDGVTSIQTPYDRMLDRESDSHGQLMEKMVSGRYLGEIVRLIVRDAASKGEAFADWVDGGSMFGVPYAFTTEHLSDVVHDETRELKGVAMLLGRLGVAATDPDERRLFREICGLVAGRSARLAAMGIAATASFVDPSLANEHVVAADGSLFRGYPGYQGLIQSGLQDILGDARARRVQVAYVRDGSGTGAAIIAAVASSRASAENPTR